MTRWLLNSAVLAAGAYGRYRFEAATVDDLREFCRAPQRPVSRIGYPETAALIARLTGWHPPLSRDPSPLGPGDVAMVVRLRYRVQPGPKTIHVEDDPLTWEIARITRES